MRAKPTYTEPFVEGNETSASWYRFFSDLDQGAPPTSESRISVLSSPFTYTAPRAGNVIVSGGTVSQIQISRGMVKYLTGVNVGQFTLGLGDNLIVTYTGAPLMVFFPS